MAYSPISVVEPIARNRFSNEAIDEDGSHSSHHAGSLKRALTDLAH